MKLRCLPICALLVAPAMSAWGQSTITIYGLVDAAVTSTRAGTGVTTLGGATPTAKTTTKQLDSGVGPGGRLGFRGLEDLGDGLKAVFTLESGIAADTGAIQQGGTFFGRQAFVGVRADQWSLTAGRQYAPMDPVLAMTDALGGSYWGNVLTNTGHIIYAGLGAAPGGGTYQTPSRVDNSILGSYQSGPVSSSLMVAAGNENQRGTGRLIAASVSYFGKPLQVHAAYTRVRQNVEAILPTASPEWLSEYVLGATYELAPAKLYAGYYGMKGPKNQANLGPGSTANPFGYSWRKTNTAWIGMRVPVGTAGALMAQVARITYDYGTGSEGRGTLFGLAYEHMLSKRTTLYATVGRMDNNDRAKGYLSAGVALMLPNGYGSKLSAASVGMRHAF